MVTLQLLQKPSLNSIFSVSHYHQPHHSSQLPQFRLNIPRASATPKSRRQIITETATATAISLVSGLPLSAQKGIAAEELSEWERVYLPIDPGVVLLDISFVPDDPSHALVMFCITQPIERHEISRAQGLKFSGSGEANWKS